MQARRADTRNPRTRRPALAGIVLALGVLMLPLALHLPVAAASALHAPARLAEVRYIYRGVGVQPPAHPVHAGHVHDSLFGGYGVQTQMDQRASMAFADGTTLHVNQNTALVLRSAHSTVVRSGEVAEYLAPGTNHQVQTSAAVASAIGTVFDVSIQGGVSTFIVFRGKLRVANGAGQVYVVSNHLTHVRPNQPPSPPIQVDASQAFAWTDQIPTPDLGEDVALDGNGGLATASSQRGGAWSVSHINDGLISTGWETAEGKPRNQWVKIAFAAGEAYRIATVVIDPAATRGDPASMDLKDFEIRVSSTGTSEADFVTVLRARCRPAATLQRFTLATDVQARYVELRVLSNWGNAPRTAVAELEILAPTASFAIPSSVATDAQGNVYVADQANFRVVKLSPMGQVLTTWGSKGTGPGQFGAPDGIAVAPDGTVYVTDFRNDTVQAFSADGALLHSWGSEGSGPSQFHVPFAVTVDSRGNVYVADNGNGRIEKFSASGTWLATIGSRGTQPGQFLHPESVAVDGMGNLYVVDSDWSRLQKLAPDGTPLPFPSATCGAGGLPATPGNVAVDAGGDVYVTDVRNHCLAKRSPSGAVLQVSPLQQLLYDSRVSTSAPVAVDPNGTIYVVDILHAHLLRLAASGAPLEQWGMFGALPTTMTSPYGLAVDGHDNVYLTDGDVDRVQERTAGGRVVAIVGRAGFLGRRKTVLGELVFVHDLAVDDRGRIFVADETSHRLQVLSARRAIGFFPRQPLFRAPFGVAIDHQHNVYVSDYGDSVIELSPAGKVIRTLGTKGRYGTAPGQFNGAVSMAVDAQNRLYVVDEGNRRVQEFSPSGRLLSIWGVGSLNDPVGIDVDRRGNVYVADYGLSQILKFSPSRKLVAVWGSRGNGRDELLFPIDVAVDSHGNVYVSDSNNSRVVKRAPDGTVLAIWQ